MLDGRLLPGFSPEHLLGELRAVLGDDVDLEVVRFDRGAAEPDMSLFRTLAGILERADPGSTATPLLMPGVSDGRFFSRLGIQTYGFVPMKLPPGSTSGRACTGPTSASPPRQSTSARTPCTRRCAASERPPERPAATRWALTVPFNAVPLREHRALLEGAEAVGFTDLWSGETSGPDGFTPLALAAAWTERMRLGTGVVNAFTRGPAVLAQHAAALQDASGGRFCLGIGSSSNVIVERWNQIPFEKPLTKVRETVEVLRAVLGGERGPGGFKLDSPPETPAADLHRGAARAACCGWAARWATGRSSTSCRSRASRR